MREKENDERLKIKKIWHIYIYIYKLLQATVTNNTIIHWLDLVLK